MGPQRLLCASVGLVLLASGGSYAPHYTTHHSPHLTHAPVHTYTDGHVRTYTHTARSTALHAAQDDGACAMHAFPTRACREFRHCTAHVSPREQTEHTHTHTHSFVRLCAVVRYRASCLLPPHHTAPHHTAHVCVSGDMGLDAAARRDLEAFARDCNPKLQYFDPLQLAAKQVTPVA